jgi:methylenetetrahydrofolate reductase (NADPH)
MMKISEIYRGASSKRHVYSFEFFPPKNSEGEEKLFSTIRDLKPLHPDFVSVTYGAGGSTRAKTLEWVTRIEELHSIPAMAHFTCVGASRNDIRESLREIYNAGIRNIMALRGDPPKGEALFRPAPDGFTYASELISFIRSSGFDFALGAACYPEKHPEAATPEEDLRNLKTKVDAGPDFLVTQLFFDNEAFFRFEERCRRIGIDIPIVPGIMPITHFKQVERFTAMAGCSFPQGLLKEIRQCGEDEEELRRISLRFSVGQCRELLDRGAPGIHFYTMNQSTMTADILKKLIS